MRGYSYFFETDGGNYARFRKISVVLSVLLLSACGGGGGSGGPDDGVDPGPSIPLPPVVNPIQPGSLNYDKYYSNDYKVTLPVPQGWDRDSDTGSNAFEVIFVSNSLATTESFPALFFLGRGTDEEDPDPDGVGSISLVSSRNVSVDGVLATEDVVDATFNVGVDVDARLALTGYEFLSEQFGFVYVAEQDFYPRHQEVYEYMRSEMRLGQTVFDGLTSGSNWASELGDVAIASDGRNFLVLACRENSSVTDIDLVGRIIFDDRSMGEEFVVQEDIDAFNSGCGYTQPSVVFDGVNYFAVYTKRLPDGLKVFIQRISTLGELVDVSPIQVSEVDPSEPFTDSMGPSVAFDGSKLLVVWSENDPLNQIRGAFVQPDGSVSENFVIHEDVQSDYERIGEFIPKVAYGNNQFLVTWSQRVFREINYSSSNSIYGQLLDLSGNTLLSDALLIREDDGSKVPRYVGVASNGEEYLVGWIEGLLDPSANSEWNVVASTVSQSGTLSGGSSSGPGFVLAESVERSRGTGDVQREDLRLVFDGDEYQFLWSTGISEPEDGIYGVSLASNLSSISAIETVAGADGDTLRGDLSRPALPNMAVSDSDGMVVWVSENGVLEAWRNIE